MTSAKAAPQTTKQTAVAKAAPTASPQVSPAGANPLWSQLVTYNALPAVQAKLTVGAPDDPFEQQADAVAAQVMRTPASANPQPTPQVTQVVSSPDAGAPLAPEVRERIEPALGADLSHVRVHSNPAAQQAAADISAKAFTHQSHIFLGAGQQSADLALMAHEATHVVQQSGDKPQLQRYGDPIPPVAHPTVRTMVEYIDLVRRVEAANPTLGALQIAQLLMRTKYHSSGFDYLLPTSAGGAGVTPGGGVTADDVTTLTGEFEVTLPEGGSTDASHIVTAITAGAESQAPGANFAGGLAGLTISALPAGVSQRDVATWVGDVASAAAEWGTAHPHPRGGTTKQAYMDEYSPDFDLMGDIDGIVMTSTSSAAGFVFDPATPLSSNLNRFYFPTGAREGKNRRFHGFCQMEGFGLEADGVTLNAAAISNIRSRVQLNADWFQRNDPNLTAWMVLNSEGLINPIRDAWIARANDWTWFASRFIDFVQRNLTAEGA